MGRVCTQPRHANAAGFTLLELVVVLAIIGLTMTLVIPRGRGAVADAAVAASAARFAAALRVSKAESQRTSTDRTLSLDVDKLRYWSDADPIHRAIDPRISIEVGDDTLERDGSIRQFRFRPDGGATGALLVWRDGRSEARIAVDWLTGATTLNTGYK